MSFGTYLIRSINNTSMRRAALLEIGTVLAEDAFEIDEYINNSVPQVECMK